MNKFELRHSLLAARRTLSLEQRLAFGKQIHDKTISQPEWRCAQTLGCYLALPDEVPTRDIILSALEKGKRVVVPKTNLQQQQITFHAFSGFSSLASGPLGILEPEEDGLPAHELDLLLVPGVGFDLQGHRLGFGKGLFDRFLAATKVLSFGLAFEVQIIAALPVAPHDLPVSRIITEKRIIIP